MHPTLGVVGLGSVPGQGTRSHTRQLKIPQAATKKKKKVLHAASKAQHSQINKQTFLKNCLPTVCFALSVILTVISPTINKDKDLLMN